MFKSRPVFYSGGFAVLIALGALAACSGGCGNCTVPPFRVATTIPTTIATVIPTTVPTTNASGLPTTIPTTIATIIPTTVPTIIPTVIPIPTPTPSPTPTPVPVVIPPIVVPPAIPLTCAQNAITGQGVPLGTSANFAVLAGSTVTAGGLPPTTITGDLGVSPGAAVTGFGAGGPGIVIGAIHAGDPTAATAQADLTTAYNNAAGRAAGAVPADIGGTVIAPGVWKAPVSLAITGNVTLDGQNDPNSVFIFQAAASTLTANVGSSVTLINMANACNVFWQVGSSATLNGLTFNGNVMALASISVGTGTTVNGRMMARTGAVTFAGTDTVSKPGP